MSASDDTLNPTLVPLKINEDAKGTLRAFESPNIPFPIKRVFTISVLRDGEIRGEHAHKTCWQYFFSVGGNVKIRVINRNIDTVFNLHDSEALLVPPGNWCQINFPSYLSSLVVLASEQYDPDDYIFEKPSSDKSDSK
jgi:dTDP-4-dehydrorhamnose 3,5-epimerase-like enzyme